MSENEKPTLAGHPAAVKVANKRVVQQRKSSGSEKITSEELHKQQEEFGTPASDEATNHPSPTSAQLSPAMARLRDAPACITNPTHNRTLGWVRHLVG